MVETPKPTQEPSRKLIRVLPMRGFEKQDVVEVDYTSDEASEKDSGEEVEITNPILVGSPTSKKVNYIFMFNLLGGVELYGTSRPRINRDEEDLVDLDSD